MTSPGKSLHSRSVPNSPKRSPTVVNKRRQLIQDSVNRLLMDLMLAQPSQPLKFIEEYFSYPEDSIERHVVSLKALDPLRISNGIVFHKIFQSLCSPSTNYLQHEIVVDLVDRCLSDCDFSLEEFLSSKQEFHGHAIGFRTFRMLLMECLSYRRIKQFTDELEASNSMHDTPSAAGLWTAIEEVIPCQHKGEMREALLPQATIRLPHQGADLYKTVIFETYILILLVKNEEF